MTKNPFRPPERPAEGARPELECETMAGTQRQYAQIGGRLTAWLRVAFFCVVLLSALSGTSETEWRGEVLAGVVYGLAVAATLWVTTRSPQKDRLNDYSHYYVALDIFLVFSLQLLSSGGYTALILFFTLPCLVAFQTNLKTRRAAMQLGAIFLTTTISIVEDAEIIPNIGVIESASLILVQGFLCVSAYLYCRIKKDYIGQVSDLTRRTEILLSDVMSAAEMERRSVAESLHDGPLQSIYACMQDLRDISFEYEDPRMLRTAATLKDVSGDLRQLTNQLHPAVIERVGISVAIRLVADDMSRRRGIILRSSIANVAAGANDSVLFGVARELLSNVARHSMATTVDVALVTHNDRVVLDVIDDGQGFEPDVIFKRLSEGHIGLASHRARVHAAGGIFTFASTVGEGTHMHVDLPMSDC